MRFSAPTSSGQGTLSVLKSWGALQRRIDNGICLDAVVETQPYLWSEDIFVSRRSGNSVCPPVLDQLPAITTAGTADTSHGVDPPMRGTVAILRR
jgi:hypothetical protein